MTKSQMKFVAESYATYFGRAADADTIKEYGLKENGKAEEKSVILENIIAEADVEKGQIDPADFVNNAFQNLFGRNATTKEMSKYYKVVDAGKDLPIQSIVKSATKTDKAVYNNKMAVAVKYAELGGKGDLDLSKISKGNTVDLNFLNTVTKAADLKAKVDTLADKSGIPSSFDGKTFVLTTGVDAGKDFVGTNKGDLFVSADVNVNGTQTPTSSVADTIDGGKGVDTFKLYASTTNNVDGTKLPTLKNIENVVLYDNPAAAAVKLEKWDTVETLFLVRDAATSYALGEKVTTVNLEDNSAAAKTLTFDKALTAATLGVNNVTAGTAPVVTVAGTALKTLTVDAYGKASNVALVNTAIETLNITGKANLTLDATNTSITAVKTVDGSKAEGNLTLSKLATMTSVKTGSGNDTVNVAAAAAVASGDTINLGAGNDKLVKVGAGTVANSTTTVIDGGAGIDSLDAALVTAGNAGVFANFETLSINTTADLDLALLNKSTFTKIAIDGASTSTVRNVSTSQSLAVNATGTSTTLLFKDVAGTADAYTINFDKEKTGTIDAKIVIIDKIETVTVNSLGKTSAAADTNKIDLRDADAKSLVITGDKAISVTFNTAFGTANALAGDGKGVATIDASAATGAITINTTSVGVAENGLTIKGGTAGDSITLNQKATVDAGAGDDTITVSAAGGTLTGGAGKDTFDVKAAAAGTALTETAGIVKTTITAVDAGDTIIFSGKGTEVFNKLQVNVSTAANLDNALALALAGDGNTNGIVNWFQYAGNTYLVEDTATGGTVAATDLVVKINGLVDLTNSTFVDGATGILTIA